MNCPRHGGQRIEGLDSRLDPIMRELPDSQAQAGRHKCTYCAYLTGRQDALREILNFVNRLSQ